MTPHVCGMNSRPRLEMMRYMGFSASSAKEFMSKAENTGYLEMAGFERVLFVAKDAKIIQDCRFQKWGRWRWTQ